MKLERMTGPEHPLYAAAWALYEAAFPANERRDAEWQARALAQDAYHMCAAAEDGTLCAIAFYWMHGGELFLEHLAVASELRGRGIGAALLREIRELPGKLILEIEKPDDAKTQVLRARGLDACAVWLRCAGLSGGDGRLRLAADERGRDEQAGICAALRIFAGGRAGLHGGRREAALYMEGIGEA